MNALVDRLGPGRYPVLDVGGGHAQIATPLAARGHAVTVLGSDSACGERVAGCAGVRFVVGELTDPPFADRSFDLVTCFRILPHVSAWPALLAGLCRVSAAAVIVDFPVGRSVNAFAPLLFALKKRFEGNTRPFATFTVESVASELRKHGFAVEAAVREFALPMVIHRMFDSPRLSRSLEGMARSAGVTGRFGSPVILLARRVAGPAAVPLAALGTRRRVADIRTSTATL